MESLFQIFIFQFRFKFHCQSQKFWVRQGWRSTSAISYRCSKSLQSMCYSRSLHGSLTLAQIFPSQVSSLVKTLSSTSLKSEPLNGISPQRSSYRITPRPQTSLLKSLGYSLMISGDLYPIVPLSCLKHSSSSSQQAKPKSAILTLGRSLRLLSKMFLCLMSRWTIYSL